MREELPLRRDSATFTLLWPKTAYKPQVIVVTVGFYRDGRAGELFVTAGKSGEQLESSTRDGAIVASMAMQAGVPLSDMLAAITRETDNAPSSLLGTILEGAATEIEKLKAELQ